MKKPFNVRLPVVWAVSLISGIVYSALLLYFKLGGIYTLIPAIIMFSACVPVAIFMRKGGKPFILLSVAFIFLFGALYAYARGASIALDDAPLGGVTRITGRVTATGITSGGVRYAVLGGAEAGGVRLKGKLVAYLSQDGGNYFRVGYTVSFYSRPELVDVVEYGDLGYSFCRNYRYCCYGVSELVAHYGFSPFGEIYHALETVLFDSLDGETASVCLALLTGNTDFVSTGTLTAFRNGGIAHVFAVSGLHIGVIFTSLGAVFKKLHLKITLSAFIRIALITLYAGVCGFSPSSVRAVVMCSSSALAKCVKRKNDGLNAIALSAIILLAVNPFYLFDVGFALSYGAVSGILLVSHGLNTLFRRLPYFIRNPLSSCLSVYVGTVPVMLTAFGNVSVAGVLLNLIFIPAVSALYVGLFVCAVFCSVFPFVAGALLPAVTLPIQLLINLVADAGFAEALLTPQVSRLIYLPFFAVTLALTDKLNIRPLFRSAVFFSAVTVFTVGLASASPESVASVTFSAGFSGGSVKIDSAYGSVLIVTSDYTPRSDYYGETDALIVVSRDDHLPAINVTDCNAEIIYVCGATIDAPSVGSAEVIRADEFAVCNVNFTFDGTVLYFELCGEGFAVEVGYQGDMYGAIDNFGGYKLLCYDSCDAVLFTPSEDLNLARCGSMRLEIRNGKLLPSSVTAKE